MSVLFMNSEEGVCNGENEKDADHGGSRGVHAESYIMPDAYRRSGRIAERVSAGYIVTVN